MSKRPRDVEEYLRQSRAYDAMPAVSAASAQSDPLFAEYESQQDPLFAEYDAQKPPVTDRREAFVKSLITGLTLGTVDRGAAALEALFTDKPYSASLAQRRGFTDLARKEHPGTTLAGELLGGAALPVGAAAGAKTLGAAVKAGAKTGAVSGAITGAAESRGEDVGDYVRDATVGSAVGAAGGAVAAPLARGVSTVGRAVADITGLRLPARAPAGGLEYRYTGPASIDDLRGSLRTVEERADDKLLQSLERAGLTRETIEKAGQATDVKPETILDLGGQNVRRLGRAVRTTPGKGSEELDRFMANRAAGAEERILDDLLETTGRGARTNTVAEFDALVDARRANAQPLYETAYEATIQSKVVKEALDIPEFQRAYEAGRRIARVEKRALPSIEEGIKSGFPVEAIDYMKRGLDAVIETGSESGRSLSRTEARALRNRLGEVLEDVDQAVPAYKQARAQFAGDSELIEALEQGKKLFTMHPDEANKVLEGLSEAGRDRFRQGALEALADRIEGVAPGNDISRRVAEKTLDQKRLRLVFPDDASFGRFQELIGREANMNASRNFLRGNSQTADKLAELADLAGVSIDALFSGPGALAQRGMRALIERGRAGMTERTAEALSKRLTAETGSQSFQALLEALTQAELRATQQATRQAGTAGRAGRAAAQIERR